MRVTCAVAVLAFAGLAGCDQMKRAAGSGAGVPEDWTHQELTEHINRKGVSARFFVSSTGGGIVPPSGYYVLDAKIKDIRDAEAEYKAGGRGVVTCSLRKTTQEAKDQAGTYSGRGFASGRFVFGSPDPAALEAIRRALP